MVLAQTQKYRPMEQDRKLRDKSCTYGHPIHDKEGKNIQWKGKKKTKTQQSLWQVILWSTPCKRVKLEHFLTPYTNINSKGLKI